MTRYEELVPVNSYRYEFFGTSHVGPDSSNSFRSHRGARLTALRAVTYRNELVRVGEQTRDWNWLQFDYQGERPRKDPSTMAQDRATSKNIDPNRNELLERVPDGGTDKRSLNPEAVSFPVHPDDPDTLPKQVERLQDQINTVEQLVLELDLQTRSGSESTGTSSSSHVISCTSTLEPGIGRSVAFRERISGGTRLVAGIICGEGKRTTSNVKGTYTIWPVQVFSESGSYVAHATQAPADVQMADILVNDFVVIS